MTEAARVHIAFFNRCYYPDTTATGQLLTELCEGLVHDHGCRVTVVAGFPMRSVSGTRPSRQHALVRRDLHNGVVLLRARGTQFLKTRFSGRAMNYMTYFFAACLAGLRLERPDVVVALTDPPIIGLAALLVARRSGAPFVMAFQDIFPEVAEILKVSRSKMLNRILQHVTCFLVRNASVNVALGDTMRQRLVEGKGAATERTIVIPNWANCDAITPTAKRNAFSINAGLSECFVVMHSGNIGLSQDLVVLIQAASRLRGIPDIQVVFVGDGVERASLEDQVDKLGLPNVRFLPYQPKASLRDSFASADVFVISLKKGLAGYIVPSKLYGILAAGRPYVAAVEETTEVAAVTRKYECGLLASPGNAEDLAEKILTLYRDRALAERLGANGRSAAAEYDRPIQVKAYYDLFQGLVRAQ